jgi:hypothetical protein
MLDVDLTAGEPAAGGRPRRRWRCSPQPAPVMAGPVPVTGALYGDVHGSVGGGAPRALPCRPTGTAFTNLTGLDYEPTVRYCASAVTDT